MAWWQYEDEEKRRQREAQRFNDWAKRTYTPDINTVDIQRPSWQPAPAPPSSYRRSSPPVTGPDAAAQFEIDAQPQLREWQRAILGVEQPPPTPAPPEKPWWENLGETVGGALGAAGETLGGIGAQIGQAAATPPPPTSPYPGLPPQYQGRGMSAEAIPQGGQPNVMSLEDLRREFVGGIGETAAGQIAPSLEYLRSQGFLDPEAALGTPFMVASNITGQAQKRRAAEQVAKEAAMQAEIGTMSDADKATFAGLNPQQLESLAASRVLPGSTAESIQKWGERIIKENPSTPYVTEGKDFFQMAQDPEYWRKVPVRSAPTTLAMMGTGILLALGGRQIAAQAGLKGLAQFVIADLTPQVINRVGESIMEAAGARQQALEEGQSRDDALAAANKTFALNMAWAPVDALQMRYALKAATGAMPKKAVEDVFAQIAKDQTKGGKATNLAKAALGYLAETGSQGVEEGYQEISKNVAMGKPLEWTPEATAGALAGMATGAVMGSPSAATDVRNAATGSRTETLGDLARAMAEKAKRVRPGLNIEPVSEAEPSMEDMLKAIGKDPEAAARDRARLLAAEKPPAPKPEPPAPEAPALFTLPEEAPKPEVAESKVAESPPEVAKPDSSSAIQAPLYHVTVNKEALLRGGYSDAAAQDAGLGRNVGGYVFTSADPRSVKAMEQTLGDLKSAWEKMGKPDADTFYQRLETEDRPLWDRKREYIIEGDPAKWNDIGVVQVVVDVPKGWVAKTHTGNAEADAEFLAPPNVPKAYVHADIRDAYPAQGIQGVVSVPVDYFKPEGTAPKMGNARIVDVAKPELQPNAQAAIPQAIPVAIEQPVAEVKPEVALTTRVVGKPPRQPYVRDNTNPDIKHDVDYEILPIDQVVTSHEPDTLKPAPATAYDQELQRRGSRGSDVGRAQIDAIKARPAFDWMITDLPKSTEGTPIIGDADNMVEAGNGRVIALKEMQAHEPQKFAQYQAELKAQAERFGLTPEQIDAVPNGILVRRRKNAFDTDEGRYQFAESTNKGTMGVVTAVDQAINERNLIDDEVLSRMSMEGDADIDKAINKDKGLVASFLKNFTPEEQRALTKEEKATKARYLTKEGLSRVKRALLAHVLMKGYRGAETDGKQAVKDIISTVFEKADTDPMYQHVSDGILAAAPQLAAVEASVSKGERDQGLSIMKPLVQALNGWTEVGRLRDAGMDKNEAVTQVRDGIKPATGQAMMDLGEQTAPFFEKKDVLAKTIFDYFAQQEGGRGIVGARKIRDVLRSYAEMAGQQPNPLEASMFGPVVERKPADELWNDAVGAQLKTQASEAGKQLSLDAHDENWQAGERSFAAKWRKRTKSEGHIAYVGDQELLIDDSGRLVTADAAKAPVGKNRTGTFTKATPDQIESLVKEQLIAASERGHISGVPLAGDDTDAITAAIDAIAANAAKMAKDAAPAGIRIDDLPAVDYGVLGFNVPTPMELDQAFRDIASMPDAFWPAVGGPAGITPAVRRQAGTLVRAIGDILMRVKKQDAAQLDALLGNEDDLKVLLTALYKRATGIPLPKGADDKAIPIEDVFHQGFAMLGASDWQNVSAVEEADGNKRNVPLPDMLQWLVTRLEALSEMKSPEHLPLTDGMVYTYDPGGTGEYGAVIRSSEGTPLPFAGARVDAWVADARAARQAEHLRQAAQTEAQRLAEEQARLDAIATANAYSSAASTDPPAAATPEVQVGDPAGPAQAAVQAQASAGQPSLVGRVPPRRPRPPRRGRSTALPSGDNLPKISIVRDQDENAEYGYALVAISGATPGKDSEKYLQVLTEAKEYSLNETVQERAQRLSHVILFGPPEAGRPMPRALTAAEQAEVDLYAQKLGFTDVVDMVDTLDSAGGTVGSYFNDMLDHPDITPAWDDTVYALTGLAPSHGRTQVERERNRAINTRAAVILNFVGVRRVEAEMVNDVWKFHTQALDELAFRGTPDAPAHPAPTLPDWDKRAPVRPLPPAPAAARPEASGTPGGLAVPSQLEILPRRGPQKAVWKPTVSANRKSAKMNSAADYMDGTLNRGLFAPTGYRSGLAALTGRKAEVRTDRPIQKAIGAVMATGIMAPVRVPLRWFLRHMDPVTMSFDAREKFTSLYWRLETDREGAQKQIMGALGNYWHTANQKVKIDQDGRVTEGVRPNPQNPNASMAIGDIVENPELYSFSDPGFVRWIKTYYKVMAEQAADLKALGAEVPRVLRKTNGHYLARLITVRHEVEQEETGVSEGKRSYRLMEQGIKEGIKYNNDPMLMAAAGVRFMLTQNIGHQMNRAVDTYLGAKTPDQMVDAWLKAQIDATVNQKKIVEKYIATLTSMMASKEMTDPTAVDTHGNTQYRILPAILNMAKMMGPEANILRLVEVAQSVMQSTRLLNDAAGQPMTQEQRREIWGASLAQATMILDNINKDLGDVKVEKSLRHQEFQDINSLSAGGKLKDQPEAFNPRTIAQWRIDNAVRNLDAPTGVDARKWRRIVRVAREEVAKETLRYQPKTRADAINEMAALLSGRPVKNLRPQDMADADAEAVTWGYTDLADFLDTIERESPYMTGAVQPGDRANRRPGGPEGRAGTGMAEINATWGKGKILSAEDAVIVTKAIAPEGEILKTLDTANGAIVTAKAGFDIGTPMVQGALLAGYDPILAGKAFAEMMRMMMRPERYGEWAASKRVRECWRLLQPEGLMIEGSDVMNAMERPGAIYTIAQKAAEVAREKNQPLGDAMKAVIEFPVLRVPAKRLELGFEAYLNYAKTELAISLMPQFVGRPAELAALVNNFMGTRSSMQQGVGSSQRVIERIFLAFSARYNRGFYGLVGMAMGGGAEGRVARRSLISYLMAGYLLVAGLRALAQQPIDDPDDDWYNPFSSKWMTLKVFGRRVGMGGAPRAMYSVIFQSLKAGYEDPSVFLKPLDRTNNPITRYLASRTAPVGGFAWNVVSGRDFMGEPVQPGWDYVKMGVKSFIAPMWLDEYITIGSEKMPDFWGIAPDVAGLRAIQVSASQEKADLRNKLARQEYGKAWKDLHEGQWAALRAKYPDLMQAEEFSRARGMEKDVLEDRFWWEVGQVRVEQEKVMEDAKAQLLAGTGGMTGNKYRGIVADAEATIGQAAIMLKGKKTEFKDIPLTEDERKAYYGARYEPRTNPVSLYINSYYMLTTLAQDPNTKEIDFDLLSKWRDDLKATAPADVAKEAQDYIDSRKDPDLLKAQKVMQEMQKMPAYIGQSLERSRELDRAYRLLSAEASFRLGSANALGLAAVQQKYGSRIAADARLASTLPRNPQRKLFAAKKENRDLLMRYYTDAYFVEVPSAEQRQAIEADIYTRPSTIPMPTAIPYITPPTAAPNWRDALWQGIQGIARP